MSSVFPLDDDRLVEDIIVRMEAAEAFNLAFASLYAARLQTATRPSPPALNSVIGFYSRSSSISDALIRSSGILGRSKGKPWLALGGFVDEFFPGTQSRNITVQPKRVDHIPTLVSAVGDETVISQVPLSRFAREYSGAALQSWLIIPEIVDPIRVLKSFLADRCALGEDLAHHFLQRALRRHFSMLRYTVPSRRALRAVSDRYNEVFYETSDVHPDSARREQPLLSQSLLLEEFAFALAAAIDEQDVADLKPNFPDWSLGLLYFLRLGLQVSQSYAVANVDPATVTPVVVSQRPLEYSFLLARTFGGISGIPGLNYIFRGGIVPSASRGRTMLISGPPGSGKTAFGITLAADIANRRRISIYCPFEESPSAIFDRLVALGLWRMDQENRYHIAPVRQSTIAADVAIGLESADAKGILFVYWNDSGPKVDFADSIATIVKGFPRAKRTWRALIVDSLEALHLDQSDQWEEEAPVRNLRWSASGLLKIIENLNLWGILIAGDDKDPQQKAYSYLSNTLIHLSMDEAYNNRWLEIRKSREQEYHPGPHHFHVDSAKGIRIFPSTESRRATYRIRNAVSPGSRGKLQIPVARIPAQRHSAEFGFLPDPCSTLIYSQLTGDTLSYALGVTLASGLEGSTIPLIVSFARSTDRMRAFIETSTTWKERWAASPSGLIRTITACNSLTSNEFLSGLEGDLRQARRRGAPIGRVLFDSIDLSEQLLPALARDRLLWPAVVDLMRVEGVTCSFTCNYRLESAVPLVHTMWNLVDYVFEVQTEGHSGVWLRKGRQV